MEEGEENGGEVGSFYLLTKGRGPGCVLDGPVWWTGLDLVLVLGLVLVYK